jgi:acyl-coenzyme A thioesterase PaaI-like protein
MLDQQILSHFVLQAVPYNQRFDMKLGLIQENELELILCEHAEYKNHVGTVHAGAQFSLADAASGAMVANAFLDLFSLGITPLVSQSTANYKKAAYGNLHAKATIERAEQERVRQEIQTANKSHVVVQIILSDEQEAIVSEMSFKWVFLKQVLV